MQSPVLERIEADVNQCRHHWLIESPHGATSMGVCKICGEEREFRNSASDSLWEGDPMASANRLANGGRERRPVGALAEVARED